jgi:hypothetical protein
MRASARIEESTRHSLQERANASLKDIGVDRDILAQGRTETFRWGSGASVFSSDVGAPPTKLRDVFGALDGARLGDEALYLSSIFQT